MWKDFKLAYDLKGHAQSVLTVVAIDGEEFITGQNALCFPCPRPTDIGNKGSADKTVKLWKQHKVVRTFTGHKDAVRGLALVTDIGFASCSNDRQVHRNHSCILSTNCRSEIHVWTLEGDLVYSLSGHTSFIYGLSILPNGDIVSCGEDRSVRVWRGASVFCQAFPLLVTPVPICTRRW